MARAGSGSGADDPTYEVSGTLEVVARQILHDHDPASRLWLPNLPTPSYRVYAALARWTVPAHAVWLWFRRRPEVLHPRNQPSSSMAESGAYHFRHRLQPAPGHGPGSSPPHKDSNRR